MCLYLLLNQIMYGGNYLSLYISIKLLWLRLFDVSSKIHLFFAIAIF